MLVDFSPFTVAVIGDLMLDEYIWGRVDRISPEAPVPIVLVEQKTKVLGGAGNVAANIAALGARVLLFSVIGEDAAGAELQRICPKDSFLLVDSQRVTPLKTRILAHTQQVARIDSEQIQDILISQAEILAQELLKADFHAVIVSDYGKGVINCWLMDRIKQIAQYKNAIVAVDPVPQNQPYYEGVSVITPNEAEYKAMWDINGQYDTLLVTKGPQGMTLFHKNIKTDIPTVAKKVYDVSGAGDTVIAAFTLGLVSGLNPVDAAKLANKAAGMVVAELGTAVITLDQLMGD